MSEQSAESDAVFNATTEALLASIGDQIQQTGVASLIADWAVLTTAIRYSGSDATKPTREGWAVAMAENTRQAAPRTKPLADESTRLRDPDEHGPACGCASCHLQYRHQSPIIPPGGTSGVAEAAADLRSLCDDYNEDGRDAVPIERLHRWADELEGVDTAANQALRRRTPAEVHRDALADTSHAYRSFHGWVLECLWCGFEAVGKTKAEALRGMQRHYDAVLPEGAEIHG